ncbi:hypothetical protein AX774_g6706, partial [Zancudomyces culisetae]
MLKFDGPHRTRSSMLLRDCRSDSTRHNLRNSNGVILFESIPIDDVK